jgi:hypothetical protein
MLVNDSPAGLMNWQDVIFDPKFMGRLEMFAKKRFGDNSLAEEACTFSLDKLLDPSWQARRLNQYAGRSSPAGFVFSAFRMLLEDFARHRFGRPRPPAWLKRLGPIWEKVFNLLCLERLETEGIHTRLQSVGNQELHEHIEEAVVVIRSRVTNCGEQIGETPHDFQEFEIADGKSACGKGSEYEEKKSKETIVGILTSLAAVLSLEQGDPPGQSLERIKAVPSQRIASDAAKVATAFRLHLADEDKLLLRMVYQDGRKVSEAARILGTPEHILRRRLKQSLDELRKQLEQWGLGLDVLSSMLNEPQ